MERKPHLAVVALAALASGAGAQCGVDKLTASDGDAKDSFGWPVSISGDTALVGAISDDDACPLDPFCDSGSAYVFEKQGSVWVEAAKLTASDGDATDRFGWSVSISGDTALVGAVGDDHFGTDSGSAYVFEKQGSVWIQTAKLRPFDAYTYDRFGTSVSVAGDLALVGAPGLTFPPFSSNPGSAYVFEKQGLAWVETAKLTASDATWSIQFGNSVSLSADTALVGAHYDEDAGPQSGSAYVFEKQGAVWVETAKLTASDAAAGDHFGHAVSLSGDTALVGAVDNDDAGSSSGSAYVFEKPPGGWMTMTETTKLTASDGAAGDRFGVSVSLSGDTALVGAYGDDDAGSAYVFGKQGTVWVEKAKLTAWDGAPGDSLGNAVSLSGKNALVGAPHDDDAGASSGSAYAFRLGTCLTGPTPGIVAVDNTVTVSLATPGGLVGLSFGLGVGATHVGPSCPGLGLDIENAVLVGTTSADVSGKGAIGGFVPAGLSGTTIYLQAVDVAACEVSNLVSHTFP